MLKDGRILRRYSPSDPEENEAPRPELDRHNLRRRRTGGGKEREREGERYRAILISGKRDFDPAIQKTHSRSRRGRHSNSARVMRDYRGRRQRREIREPVARVFCPDHSLVNSEIEWIGEEVEERRNDGMEVIRLFNLAANFLLRLHSLFLPLSSMPSFVSSTSFCFFLAYFVL